jgi:hypothetical protein
MLVLRHYEMAVDGNLLVVLQSSVFLRPSLWVGFVIDHNPEISPGAPLFRSGTITSLGSVPRGARQICVEAWAEPLL